MDAFQQPPTKRQKRDFESSSDSQSSKKKVIVGVKTNSSTLSDHELSQHFQDGLYLKTPVQGK